MEKWKNNTTQLSRAIFQSRFAWAKILQIAEAHGKNRKIIRPSFRWFVPSEFFKLQRPMGRNEM
jgi:hypothetical protein